MSIQKKFYLFISGIFITVQCFAQNPDPIHILSSVPLTGNVASFGQQAKWGTELAISEINAKGGILGRKLVVDYEDNRCNAAEAVKSVSQALSRSKYVAILDGLCSSAVLAIMPLADRAKLPMVVANGTASSISETSGKGGNQWVFKVNPSDAGLTDAIVGWLAKENKSSNIALLAEDTDFGRAGQQGLQAALSKRGEKLASTDFYQQGTADFTNVLTKLRAQKPNAIALYSVTVDFQNLLRQYVSSGVRIPLTGRLVFNDVPKEILESGALEGTITVQPYTVEIDTPANKAFVAAFEKLNNTKPNLVGFESYESMLVLADAIRRANSTDSTAIRNALKTTKFKSILETTIEFDENHLAHNNAVVMTIQKGKVIVLGFSKS